MSTLTALGSKEAEMRIIGCDLHAAQQTIALLDRDTGKIVERTLNHEGTAVRDFYAGLRPPIVVGIEATGSMGWFLELMADLGIRRARSSRSVFARLDRRLTSMLFAL